MCKSNLCRVGIGFLFLFFSTVAFAGRGYEKILYIATDAQDRSQIFAINPDGSNLVQMTSVIGEVGVTQFAVNPQGTKIAYLVFDENGDTILYVMDSDGGNARRITQTGMGSDSDPVFDIDGKTIYVQKSNGQVDAVDISGLKRIKSMNQTDYSKISAVDKSTGEIICVVSGKTRKIAKDGNIKVLSIDNARKVETNKNSIVYDKFDKTTYNIFISDLEGKNNRQVTDDANCNYDPSISPDGSKIAFCGYDIKKSNPGLNGIFSVSFDGTGYREIIRTKKRPVNTVWTILDKAPKVAPITVDWPNYWEKIIHPPQPDLMIATNIDAFRGTGQFDVEGKQKLTATIGSRRIVTYYIRLINNGTAPDAFKLTASGGQTGWKCTYFQNTKNITALLNSNTGLISPPIASGESFDFRVEVTPASTVKDDDSVTVNLLVSSLLDPQICDMVTAVTAKSGK